MRWRVFIAVAVCALALAQLTVVRGQARDAFSGSFKDPAIDYLNAPLHDAVTTLAGDVEAGRRRLGFDPANGYLKSVLDALAIPVESQVVVFSQTSLQAPIINARNPRAIYFNDHAAVGWVRGADLLELVAQDPKQGVVFYTLDQKADGARFERRTECLRCHVSWDTFGVPGTFVLSTGPEDPSGYATGGVADDRDEFARRWGGWFVTGRSVPTPNMGKTITAPPWLASAFDPSKYLTPHSDVVALMVLEHQTRIMNLLTYLGWETRIGATESRVAAVAQELADALLFVDAAPLARPIAGSSAFAERFAAAGPRDSRGRSLRELDLTRRLTKYPCSYMISSAAFDALPDRAKAAVFARIRARLSGAESAPALSASDRDAVTAILRDIKPEVFATGRTVGR